MRRIASSILAFFVVFPAFASVRLPVVNVSAGSVSARAAFGESLPVIKEKTSEEIAEVKKETVKVAQKKQDKKNVVARAASSNSVVKEPQKDVGGEILAKADVLVPRRPSNDLWAKTDSPLRMPEPQEFAVIRSDAALPEESLEDSFSAKNVAVQRPATQVVAQVKSAEKTRIASNPMSEIDAQLARLTELQKKAEASVEDKKVEKIALATRSVEEKPVQKRVVARTARPVQEVKTIREQPEVKLSRMVVPMEEEVVVRSVERVETPKLVAVNDDMSGMSPTELKKAFRKTFLSENKHLSTYEIDDRFDVSSDMTTNIEGFTSEKDLSEAGGIRPLEIKVKFRDDDAALSRANYNLLTEYAGIVLTNPTRAVQVSIPASAVKNKDDRKLAAKRLAIVEQALLDAGISEHRIMPVLSQRDEEGLVLRMISSEQYETLTQQKKDMFGDTVGKKSYKSMTW